MTPSTRPAGSASSAGSPSPSTTTVAAPVRRRPRVRAIEGQELALIAVVGLLWVVLSLATDTFLTTGNLQNILFTVAPIALIGVGMTAVIVTAGIDVSVGSQAAVVMVVVALMVRDAGLPFLPAVAVAIVTGLVLGAVNGLLVAYGGIHPIIVTFGTLNIYRFVSLQIFGTEQVAGVPDTLSPIGGGAEGRVLGVPTAWWLTMVLAAGMWCYMRFWATGRHLYAVHVVALAAGATWVAHTHPTAVVGLLAVREAEELWSAPLFPDEAVVLGEPVWVPYAAPGIALGTAVHAAVRERLHRDGAAPRLVLLGNHGIVALGATATEVETITTMAVKAARVRSVALGAGALAPLGIEHARELAGRPDEAARRTLLGGSPA